MSPNDFVLSVEDLTVSFDGFKAIDSLNLYVDQQRIARDHRPQRRGQDHAAGPDLRQDPRQPRPHQVQEHGNDEAARVPDRALRHRPQVPDAVHLRKPERVPEPGSVLPARRGVFGALFFKRTEEVKARVQAVAAEIGLDDQVDTEAGLLSHGQKQWLEIGMLLMQDPELLMLDEPIAGMSVRERELTAELLKRICKGRAMIVIEHDMEFVKRIADKVTVMHQGKILAEGSMEKVQADPRVIDVYLGH
jgi:urea transport system ATP-binding protein